nr:MBL fold metallo-hydrolase [Desulfatitalea alkaliphila]
MPGFAGFISAWAYTAGPVLLVDPGPSATADHLLTVLSRLGIRKPDLILLTHIHIDHAGGIGELARAFPRTPVVCHPKAVRHLIEPDRLWEGSLATLGDVARRYGPIAPVPAAQILAADTLAEAPVRAVPTPGHAAHQYSYLVDDLLFAGEAGGVSIALAEGGHYLRPATPPPFRLEICLESIDRLVALQPQRICYGHVGMRAQAVHWLNAHREQLQRWHRLIAEGCGPGRPDDARALEACVDHLLAHDPLLASWPRLNADDRERERFFLRNSVKGYWDYQAPKAH